MRECAQLALKKVPLEHLKEVSEKGYEKMLGVSHYLHFYNIYMMAHNIGVRFSPEDLDVDTINMLSAIKEEVEKQELKHGR